ncbi:UNVERIFIED_CONTAM: hypothetical protein PYX00_001900 [Menopon gallinae]|uniref:Uncharacterized protein n=1 Tax=Menopon gallinae TaxID=328185 RepID=A0AAW2IG18_9NEOP
MHGRDWKVLRFRARQSRSEYRPDQQESDEAAAGRGRDPGEAQRRDEDNRRGFQQGPRDLPEAPGGAGPDRDLDPAEQRRDPVHVSDVLRRAAGGRALEPPEREPRLVPADDPDPPPEDGRPEERRRHQPLLRIEASAAALHEPVRGLEGLHRLLHGGPPTRVPALERHHSKSLPVLHKHQDQPLQHRAHDRIPLHPER